jgi:cell division protein ZapA
LSQAKAKTIEVEIYDQKYSIVLKTQLEEAEVRKLAEDIDSRMREIAAGSNTADSLKVAILTALHLAQDYRELKRKCDQKTDEWSRALDQVLKKQSVL